MPKRSAQELIQHYEKKLAKLRKSENGQSVHSEPTSDFDSFITVTGDQDGIYPTQLSDSAVCDGIDAMQYPEIYQSPLAIAREEIIQTLPEATTCILPELSVSHHTTTENAHLNEQVLIPDVTPAENVDLDPELLAALGESTEDTAEYGQNIHERLPKLWLPLLKKGMSKEAKDKLLQEYLIPDNCRLLEAPKLNPEIMAAITDPIKYKDKKWVSMQQHLGSAVTAVNRAMEVLMTCDKKADALKHLSNACRLLCDIHANYTQIRVKIVSPRLDKITLGVIQETERDKMIFGENLAEKIKTAKTLEKQGLQMKRGQHQRPNIIQTASARPSFSGNWQAPPRFPPTRGRGGYRKPTTNHRRQYVPPPMPPPPPPTARGPRPMYQNRPRAPPQ